MKYSVSVIIIAYNTAKYIAECLESVLSQDLDNFEVIIIDNASTDKTASIIESYIQGRRNVTFVQIPENLGGAAAGNMGIKNAQGEYVYLMDSDDVMPPSTLSALYSCAKHNNSDVVMGRAKSIYGQKIRNFKFKFYCIPYSFAGVYHDYKQRRELLISPFYWGKIYKTAFLLENAIFMPENFLYADLFFSTKAIINAKTIVVCDHLAYLWRRFDQSDAHISITSSASQIENFSDRLQSYYDLEKLFSDEEDLRCIRLYNLVRLLIPVKTAWYDADFGKFYFDKMREYLRNISLEDVMFSPYLTAKKKGLCYLINENRFADFIRLSNPEYDLNTHSSDTGVLIQNQELLDCIPDKYLWNSSQSPKNCTLVSRKKTFSSYIFNFKVNAYSEDHFTCLRAILIGKNGREIYVPQIETLISQDGSGEFYFSIPKKVLRKYFVHEKRRIAIEMLFNDSFCSVWLSDRDKTLIL